MDKEPTKIENRPVGNGCFIAGTRFATTSGLVDISKLQSGMQLLTPNGARILRDRPTCAALAGQVVRLRAGAIAQGQPVRDILLPPDQLVLVQDHVLTAATLVSVGGLVNASSIQRDPPPAGMDWYALDFEQHELVMADGLALSSARGAGLQLAVRQLPPGPALFALRARITARIATILADHAAEMRPETVTQESDAESDWVDTHIGAPPSVRLIIDGVAHKGHSDDQQTWHFVVPAGTRWVRLASPVGKPGSDDSRHFGVAVLGLALDGIPLDLSGIATGPGFYGLEGSPSQRWRWTDGHARLNLPVSRNPRTLDITIADWHEMLQPI